MGNGKDTVVVHAGRNPPEQRGAVAPAEFHASTFLFEDMEAAVSRLDDARNPLKYPVELYGRIGTQTTFSFEQGIVELEGCNAKYCQVTPSGLSAITTALMTYLKQGDHILMVDTCYGPVRSFCDHILKKFGISVSYYDAMVGEGIVDLLEPNTGVVYLESPGSDTFEVQDVPGITRALEGVDFKGVVVMDNTWGTPYFFRPLDHGVDVSIQSASKYVVGHSDAMLGTVTVTDNPLRWTMLYLTRLALGICAGPGDANFGQRGLRTLAVRLERHERTALALARWLQQQPQVVQVLHPAFPSCPGHEAWKRDFGGRSSGLFSVVLDESLCVDDIHALANGLRLFGIGGSWGGYESLVLPFLPGVNVPTERTLNPWPSGWVVRFHAGLENPNDLIADLKQAFSRLPSPKVA